MNGVQKLDLTAGSALRKALTRQAIPVILIPDEYAA